MEQKVLERYRIFNKNDISALEDVFDTVLDKLGEIVKVEKLYLYGSFAYGIPNDSSDYDFLVVVDAYTDELLSIDKSLTQENGKAVLHIPGINREIHILLCELDLFEKRTKRLDNIFYYIKMYGHLIYDTSKLPKVQNKVLTEYSYRTTKIRESINFCKTILCSNPKINDLKYFLTILLEIYVIKLNYMSPLFGEKSLEITNHYKELFEFATLISKGEMPNILNSFCDVMSLEEYSVVKSYYDELNRFILKEFKPLKIHKNKQ